MFGLAFLFTVERADMFNQDVGSFEVRNVVDLSYMFKSALSFEGKGLSSWNVSNVETMSGLFEEAISLSTDVGIGEWDVTKVRASAHISGLSLFRCSCLLKVLFSDAHRSNSMFLCSARSSILATFFNTRALSTTTFPAGDQSARKLFR